MKNIIKALGFMGSIAITYATGYFIVIYDSHFLQLILALGLAGLLILVAFLYIYNWIKFSDEDYKIKKEERDKQIEELNKSIDLTNDYVKDLEERYA